MMWYSLRHDNEFMYEMVICCNVKWPARHNMDDGWSHDIAELKFHRDSLHVIGDDGKMYKEDPGMEKVYVARDK